MRVAVLLVMIVCVLAPAGAEVPADAKRAMRAALATCIDWQTGKADYSKTPPEGFTVASPFEALGLNIGSRLASGEASNVYWAEPHARYSMRALRLAHVGNTCAVMVLVNIVPPSLPELVADVDAALATHAPKGLRLAYFDSAADEKDHTMARYFNSDTEDLVLFVVHGWKDGKPVPGQYVVGVANK